MTNDLRKLVSEINEYLDAIKPLWREAGKRLMHITDNRLWNTEYKTYEQFLKNEWGKSRRWAYQLISSERVVQQLEENCKATSAPIVHSMSEIAARQMSSVPQELRVPVAQHIAQAHQHITPKAIKEAEEVVRKKEKPVVECDCEGNPIPPYALPYWHRKQEVQDVLTAISRMRSELKKRIESSDKMWCKQGTDQRLYAELGSVYTTVQNFLPYAVCLVCSGRVASGACDACHDTGLISEIHFKNFADKRDIDIRKKALAQSHVQP